jgi:hypothetical protein
LYDAAFQTAIRAVAETRSPGLEVNVTVDNLLPSPQECSALSVSVGATEMTTDVEPGAKTIIISPNKHQFGFTVGDQIVIGAGTSNSEENMIAGFGSSQSIVLETPLVNAHPAGTAIKVKVIADDNDDDDIDGSELEGSGDLLEDTTPRRWGSTTIVPPTTTADLAATTRSDGTVDCSSVEWACKDGTQCIRADWHCDGGAPDCADGSDEDYCGDETTTAPEGTTDAGAGCDPASAKPFDCGQSVCIKEAWVCDGEPDCDDKRDEQDCPDRQRRTGMSTAIQIDFAVSTAEAKSEDLYALLQGFDDETLALIQKALQAAGAAVQPAVFTGLVLNAPSCDLEHWRGEVASKDAMEQCPDNKHTCANGECISQSYRCDSIPDDCFDGTDEVGCDDDDAPTEAPSTDDESLFPYPMCRNYTECDAESQYETDAPTRVSDRVCRDWRECKKTEYVVEAGTNATDRQCAKLLECNEYDEFESEEPTPTSNRNCSTATRACSSPAQYETVKLTKTSDRQCEDTTQCDPTTEYQTTEPTLYRNRVCKRLTECIPGQEHETLQPNAYSDRECECDYGTFAVPKPTANNKCQPWDICRAGYEYEYEEGTNETDRWCATLTTCDFPGKEYQSAAPTDFSDRNCSKLTPKCSWPTEFESQAATTTSDRTCSNCTAECGANEYIIRTCEINRDIECAACPVPGPGEYVAASCTADAPGIMSDCHSPCANGLFEFQACHGDVLAALDAAPPFGNGSEAVVYGNRVCKLCQQCAADEFILSACNQTDDAVCQAVSECANHEFESAAETTTSDRVCENKTACADGTTYASVLPTADSNRVCTMCTACNITQYEVRACTVNDDRHCESLRVCNPTAEFESSAPNATVNRVCQTTQVCDDGFIESVAPNATADRSCIPRPVKACNATTEYESVAATANSYSVCNATTVCNSTEYESFAATPSSDRICAPYSPACDFPDQYEKTATTEKSDRVCAAVQPACQLEGSFCDVCMENLLAVQERYCIERVGAECNEANSESFKKAGLNSSDKVALCALVAAGGDSESAAVLQLAAQVCYGKFEAQPPTTVSNRVCEDITVCTAGEEEVEAPTATSDRVCEEFPLESGSGEDETTTEEPVKLESQDVSASVTTPSWLYVAIIVGGLLLVVGFIKCHHRKMGSADLNSSMVSIGGGGPGSPVLVNQETAFGPGSPPMQTFGPGSPPRSPPGSPGAGAGVGGGGSFDEPTVMTGPGTPLSTGKGPLPRYESSGGGMESYLREGGEEWLLNAGLKPGANTDLLAGTIAVSGLTGSVRDIQEKVLRDHLARSGAAHAALPLEPAGAKFTAGLANPGKNRFPTAFLYGDRFSVYNHWIAPHPSRHSHISAVIVCSCYGMVSKDCMPVWGEAS